MRDEKAREAIMIIAARVLSNHALTNPIEASDELQQITTLLNQE